MAAAPLDETLTTLLDQFEERRAASGGRVYWGVSHELFIRDFYARVDDPEPFWIGPAEAMPALRMLKQTYQSSALAGSAGPGAAKLD